MRIWANLSKTLSMVPDMHHLGIIFNKFSKLNIYKAYSGGMEGKEGWLGSRVRQFWESSPSFPLLGRNYLLVALQITSNWFLFSLWKLIKCKYFPSHLLNSSHHLDAIFPFLILVSLDGTMTGSGLGFTLSTYHMFSIKTVAAPWLHWKWQSHIDW